jgi:hypothetical protein
MLRPIICSLAAMLVCSTAGASDIRRVVTGLDANNRAVVMFDSRMPLQAGPYGLNATNLWVTNTYPLGFSFKDDTSAIPVGIYRRSTMAPNSAWWSFHRSMRRAKRRWSRAF